MYLAYLKIILCVLSSQANCSNVRVAVSPKLTKITQTVALVLSLLSLLRPQLHHQIYKPVDTEDENDNDAGVPPAVVFFV